MSDSPQLGSAPTITELRLFHKIVSKDGTYLNVAKENAITPNTLKSHLYRLYLRLGVGSVHRATAECFRLGYFFIEDEEIKHIYMRASKYAS